MRFNGEMIHCTIVIAGFGNDTGDFKSLSTEQLDNTLTVLDTALTDAPYDMLYDDICASLGDYGSITSTIPPQ